MENIYEVAQKNKIKSAILIAFFVLFSTLAIFILTNAFSVYLGYEAGGLGILGLALVISGVMSLASYWTSDRIVLAISGARPANKEKEFDFYTVAENLAIATGLPKPKLYVIEDSAPNAFATGRDPEHAVICATTGLLQKLTRTELEGVIAHEISHIKNYDTRLMSLVAVLVGTVALLGDFFLRTSGRSIVRDDRKSTSGALLIYFLGIIFALLSPLIAQIIRLAISRRREFIADAQAVSITRQPQGLISALKKISADPEPLEVANKATAHFYIVNPFKEKIKGGVGWFANLFNTHPPIEERIRLLSRML